MQANHASNYFYNQDCSLLMYFIHWKVQKEKKEKGSTSSLQRGSLPNQIWNVTGNFFIFISGNQEVSIIDNNKIKGCI